MAIQLAHMIALCHRMLKPVDSQLLEVLAVHSTSEVITRDTCEYMKIDYLVGSRTLSELLIACFQHYGVFRAPVPLHKPTYHTKCGLVGIYIYKYVRQVASGTKSGVPKSPFDESPP